jgi:hypothetical protein
MPLFLLSAGRWIKGLPWQVWAVIGLALLLFLGVRWHNGQIKDAEKRGADRAYAAVEKKARQLEAKANAVADKIRSKTDEAARTIAADADVIRVSGPGKARACPVPAASGRREPAGGGSDAAGPEMPSDDRAAVPWQWLVQRAEQCDLNRNEVLAWREWHEKLSAQR